MSFADEVFKALRIKDDEWDLWAADLEAEMKARQRARALAEFHRRQGESRITDSQR